MIQNVELCPWMAGDAFIAFPRGEVHGSRSGSRRGSRCRSRSYITPQNSIILINVPA
jgi:hypothetical protein